MVVKTSYQALLKKLDCKISMDGGINNQNINMLKESGVDIAVAGNYIFKANNYQEAINSLR